MKISNTISLVAISLVISFASVVSAQMNTDARMTQVDTTAFQKYKDIAAPQIKVPTVVEVPFANDFSNRFDFAVLDTAGNLPQPYLFTESLMAERTKVFVTVPGGVPDVNNMLDGDTRTYSEFTLPESGQGQVELTLTAAKPITLSGMTFLLDQFVALPTSVEVSSVSPGDRKILIARSPMRGNSVVFPKTTSQVWVVSFTYGQLLRINEIVLNDESAGVVGTRSLRFLAQPNHNYRIYFDADRSVSVNVGESGNLTSGVGVLKLADIATQANPQYVLADTDKDGVPDIRDNCVTVSNSDQKDVDGNGRGDACDDFDRDGIINSLDNCPNNPNFNQSDVDGDHIGDVCDTEESRLTEKYPWLPMAGVGFAGIVLVVLFAVTARGMMKKEGNKTEN